MALQANALTSIANAKEYAGVPVSDTSKDLLFERLINAASDLIERISNRNFKAQDYAEFVRTDGDAVVLVRNNPIISVNRIATGVGTAITVSFSGADIRATIAVTKSAVRLFSLSAAGVRTITPIAFTAQPTFSTMAAAISLIAGWTATVGVVDGSSDNLHRVGGLDVRGTTITLPFPDQDSFDYEIDYRLGEIRLGPDFTGLLHGHGHDHGHGHGDHGNFSGLVLVEYNGGFDPIPADVEQVALEIIKPTFHIAGLNTAVNSESIGDYSYSLGDQMKVSETQRARLAPFADIAIGGVR